MSKVIAVLGAGTGLGAAVARRFGREGFHIALVARRADRLEELVLELADEGIDATAFPADLAVPEQAAPLVERIHQQLGSIDVIEYSPISTAQKFTPAAELDAATVSELIPLLLLTPIEIVQAMLPRWRASGDGAFLLAEGYSAVEPLPNLSGLGPVMAATRNYLHALHAEVSELGIYVGTLTIASLIDGSEVSKAAQDAFDDADGPRFATVDPADLADIYWDMYTTRDAVERFHPAAFAAAQ